MSSINQTLAERFCGDPGAMAYEAPYHGVQQAAPDDEAEVSFPDGSIASCLIDGDAEWRPLPLEAQKQGPSS